MTEFNNFGKPHESQRGYFAASLYEQMVKHKDIWLISVDLGYAVFDKHFRDFPERVINTGASESSAMGISVGLALEGKIPCIYTIPSFFLRAAETINLYLKHEQIPVKMIGSGRDDDYSKHDGYSHDCVVAQTYLGLMDLQQYYPEEKDQVPGCVEDMLTNGKPSFLSLRR